MNAGAGGYWLYPTRSNILPSQNNADANSANYYDNGYAASTAESSGGTKHLTKVGAYGLSGSACGTYDQGGNVMEWTERVRGLSRGVRGGSWLFPEHSLRASWRTETPPTMESSAVGFRIARSSRFTVSRVECGGGAVIAIAGTNEKAGIGVGSAH